MTDLSINFIIRTMNAVGFVLIIVSLIFINGCAAPRPDGASSASLVPAENLEKLNQGRAALRKWKNTHGDSYTYVAEYNPQPSSQFVTRLVTVQNGQVISEKACTWEYDREPLATEEKNLANTFTLDQQYDHCERVHFPRAASAGYPVSFEFSKDGLLLSCTYSSGPDCADCGSSGFSITAVVPFNKAAIQRTACSQGEIHFERRSARLSWSAKTDLREIAQILKNGAIHYQIEGYADQLGSVEANLAIAEKRATAVKNFLVSEGVDPKRLTVISFGKEIAQWGREQDHKNRRVVIKPVY